MPLPNLCLLEADNCEIGGVQNIGKKEKEKKDKGKEKEKDKDSTDGKKKSAGIRGIRGFV